MLKKISFDDLSFGKKGIDPTIYIVHDIWSKGITTHYDVGFHTDELGYVCVQIGGEYGYADCYMLVKQEKDGIISKYAYKYDYTIYQESLKLMFKAAMQTWHTQEEMNEMKENNERIYSSDIAINTINKIIENGKICKIDECEFKENKNNKFKCDYYNHRIIWD